MLAVAHEPALVDELSQPEQRWQAERVHPGDQAGAEVVQGGVVGEVAPGRLRDYSREHPARPALIVEVAISSLSLDRNHKGSLYARARVEDYWIVNLVDRVLEVYRQPLVDAAAPFGWRYASQQTLRPGSSIVPLAAPESAVLVDDLLP